MVVVHGQVHAAAGDAGLVREDGQRGLVLAVVPPVRARWCLYMWKSNFGRPTPSTRRLLDFHTGRRDARLDARAPDPRLDDVRVVAVEPRGADNLAALCRRTSLPRNSPPPQ